jgi:hypothetical protein
VLGDFNLTGANEQAYQKLIQPGGIDGRFYDALNMPGIWDNPVYAPYHTQSTRVRSFGGGATGGLDDRFDIIMFSNPVYNNGTLKYIPQSLTAYGNDGTHYNDSISRPPNNAVGQLIANALHYSSDHLPVNALFRFGNIVSVGNNSNSVNEFTLHQNYPNPFNPSAKIQFSIPNVQFVTLKVFDVTGREVQTLVNEPLKPGTYEVTFNAGSYSGGIYFYQLQTASFRKTKKMVLVK